MPDLSFWDLVVAFVAFVGTMTWLFGHSVWREFRDQNHKGG